MSSDPVWLSVTEGLLRGTTVCSERLTDETFAGAVEYLFRTIDQQQSEAATDNLETIRSSCQLDEPEFKLVLQTLSYLVKRSLKFMLKPSALQADLRGRLALDENKANAFVRCWIAATKIVLDSLEADEDGGGSNQLEDVSWKVRAQLSSESRQKDKLALGQLELKTSRKCVNLELNSDEIVEFYNQLERIQVELDALGARRLE